MLNDKTTTTLDFKQLVEAMRILRAHLDVAKQQQNEAEELLMDELIDVLLLNSKDEETTTVVSMDVGQLFGLYCAMADYVDFLNDTNDTDEVKWYEALRDCFKRK